MGEYCRAHSDCPPKATYLSQRQTLPVLRQVANAG